MYLFWTFKQTFSSFFNNLSMFVSFRIFLISTVQNVTKPKLELNENKFISRLLQLTYTICIIFTLELVQLKNNETIWLQNVLLESIYVVLDKIHLREMFLSFVFCYDPGKKNQTIRRINISRIKEFTSSLGMLST